jgi:hypothetical protein
VSGKPTSTVREEADRKGPKPWAPRWRPTSLGERPWERAGSNPGTAPRACSVADRRADVSPGEGTRPIPGHPFRDVVARSRTSIGPAVPGGGSRWASRPGRRSTGGSGGGRPAVSPSGPLTSSASRFASSRAATPRRRPGVLDSQSVRPIPEARWPGRTRPGRTRSRRLALDRERDPAGSEELIRWAAINRMVRRLTRGGPAAGGNAGKPNRSPLNGRRATAPSPSAAGPRRRRC